MSNDFAGKVVLVTGGGKGVGRAIVHEFARLGAHVIVNYFHSGEAADRTRQEVVAEGGSAEVVRASVAKPDEVARMFEAVAERHGRLDVLVNNAARGKLVAATALTEADWDKALQVNVHGARRCSWAALPLLSRVRGAVVNLSSLGAGMVLDSYTLVGVTKAALEALTRYLAVEFGPRGVRVNAASAGLLENPTARLFPGADGLRDTCAASAPLGGLGAEEDLARLVAFLASPSAGWVTGQTFLADGGLSLGHAMLRPNGTATTARAAEPAAAPVVTPRVRTAPRGIGDVGDVTNGAGPDPVAVVGMGLVVPGADDPAEFWRLLRHGEPVFGEPGDRFRAGSFHSADPAVGDHAYTCRAGYLSQPRLHREAKADCCADDMAARWLRHSLAQAREKVAVGLGDRVGCYVGITTVGNQHLEESLLVEAAARRIAEHWPEDGSDHVELVARLRSLLTRRYPHATAGCRGHLPDEVVRSAITDLLPPGSPYTTLDTACSSSLYAVDLGVKALLAGDCDLALCGGTYTTGPQFSVLFCALRGLSRRGQVLAFDQGADGTLFSDGAAAIALKRLRRARRDGDEILAVLGGLGTSSDGRGKAITAPSRVGQEFAIRRARKVNGTPAEDIDWVVAHGTGTTVGDRVEVTTLNAFAPESGLLCTSNKSLVGHTGWPAGALSVIQAVLGLREEVVPAQRPVRALIEEAENGRVRVPRSDVPLPRRADRGRVVGVSAFGFGGTNAHLLVHDEPLPGAAEPRSGAEPDTDEVVVVGWSAHLPGEPTRDQVAARLAAGEPPADRAVFPRPYPSPPAHTLRLTGQTVEALDPTQLLALAVTKRFAEENGALWEGTEDTTGVIGAHTGTPGIAGPVLLRCYATDLLDLRAGPGDGLSDAALRRAVAGCLDAVRRERPANNEDTFPGAAPNLVPARVANHLNLHGAALAVDTGRSSALTAVHTACRYLADGSVDLALVLAVNANSTPELAAILDEDPARLAEGAFLLALCRRGDAVRRGWPVLAAVSTDPNPGQEHRPETAPAGRTYLAGDGAVDLLTALVGNVAEPTTVTGPFPGPTVTVHPAAPRERPVRARPADPRERPRPIVPAPPQHALTSRQVPVLEPEPLPAGAGGAGALPDDCLVLVGEGLADAVRHAAPGADVVVVRDTADVESSVAAALGAPARRHLRVVVEQPRADLADPVATATQTSMQEAMFLVAQHCVDRLRDRGSLGVLVLTPMRHGVPGHLTGLFTGFVKSMSWELEGCTVRAVVSDGRFADAWRALAAELDVEGGLPVVTYRAGVRYRQRLRPAPPRVGELPLRPDSVVVATGGARGITSAVVEGLVAHLPLRVWLLGSSTLTGVPEELRAAAEEDLTALRAEFIRRNRAAGAVPVAELNRRFDRLLHARETLRTLDRLRERCGADRVHYLTCDVTDGAAVRAAVERVLREDGPVDLLINGAGVHNPGDLERKTLAGFRRVRDVKLLGYRHLKEAFAARPPRLWCNFGSVTGLVGLPGEAEYSPANDVLAHAAQHESAAGRTAEYTIAWTVWDEVGLGAGPIVQSAVSRTRRLTSMPKAEGVAHFVAELAQRPPREPLVTFVGQTEKESFARLFPGFQADTPAGDPVGYFLTAPEHRGTATATWRLAFDEDREQYLRDHLVDGRPTVPGMVLVAVAAEAAQALAPGEQVRALRDLAFSAWVRNTPGREPAVYRVTAVCNRGRSGTSVLVRITSDVTTPRGEVLVRDREHFRATVLLGRRRRLTAATPSDEGARPSDDPYYRPDARVVLSGCFRATDGWRTGRAGTRARWRPDPAALPNAVGRLAVPSLLLDALARLRALRPAPDGSHPVEVPRHVRRIELFADGSDEALARRYPDGIRLWWDAAAQTHSAVAPDGTLVARVEDLRGVELCRVPAADAT